jgi:hypothetical protein
MALTWCWCDLKSRWAMFSSSQSKLSACRLGQVKRFWLHEPPSAEAFPIDRDLSFASKAEGELNDK